MKIDELMIDGFGRFHNKQFELPDAKVVIFYGPNEAGKSTLLQFLRTILFGFPSRNRAEVYPPLSGGNHGGRIRITDKFGHKFTIERYSDQRKSNAKITNDSTGSEEGELQLTQLLGNATKEVFENIFAFSLDELQGDTLLQDETVNSHIYSVGLGASKLPLALENLEKERGLIFRPRGSKQITNKIATQLDEIDLEIRELTKTTSKYSDLKQEVDQISEKSSELDNEIKDVRQYIASLRSMKDSWNNWIEFEDVRERIHNFDVPVVTPENIDSIVGNLETNLKTVEEEYESSKVNLENAEMDAQIDSLDLLILDDLGEITDLMGDETGAKNAIRDKPIVEGEKNILEEKLGEELRDLGDGWNESQLLNSRVTYPMRAEIREFGSVLDEKDRSIKDRERNLTELRNDHKKSEEDFKDITSRDDNKKPELDEETYEKTRDAINRSRSFLFRYTQLRGELGNIKVEESKLNEHAIPNLRIPIVFASFTTLITVLLGVIFLTDLVYLILLPVTSFVLALTSSYAYIFYRNKKTNQSLKLSAHDEKNRTSLRDLERELKAILNVLGIDIPGEIDAVTISDLVQEKQDHLDRIQTEINVFKEKEREFAKTKVALGSQMQKIEDLEKNIQSEKEGYSKTLQDWENWLKTKDLPSTLKPNNTNDFISIVEKARSTQEDISEKSTRIKQMEDWLANYSSRVIGLADKYNEQYTPDEPRNLVETAGRLKQRLETQQRLSIEKKEAEKRVRDCHKDFERRNTNRIKVRQELDVILEQYRCESVEDLKQLSKKNQDLEILRKKMDELQGKIRTVSGPGDKFKSFLEQLSTTTISEIETNIEYTQSELDDKENSFKELMVKRGSLSNQLEQIENENTLSDLHLKKNNLDEELTLEANKWSRYKIAEILLRRSREKFQKERHPNVLKNAESFFERMTGSRYESIVAPLGENTVLAKDSDGINKKPNQLSRGTKEQLYLSIRFGLIREYGIRSESLPVIVDEILVNFDPERSQLACDSLLELASTNQILFFTCQPEIRERFKNTSSEVAVIEI